MLDRFRIWDDSAGFIHFEYYEIDGSVEAHGAIPQNEWKALRDKIINTFPADVSISKLTDYLVVLGELV